MPEAVNTTFLESTLDVAADAHLESMVKIEHVSMIFNMASQQLNSLKEYAVAAARRELHFKEFRALSDINLDVKRGDVFGILGTNGSGKSTLLKIIAGVLDPSEGTCTINGSIAPLIELGAGFDLELTARENIYLNGALLGYTREYLDEHFNDIVEFAEIRPFLDMPMKNYSSGMVARVAFAVATVVVPDILIVDEVLSVGDFMFQQKCERKIESLIKDYQVTVLIVSHSNEQIERLCNKAVWIEKGHMRTIGDAESVCRLYHILGGHGGSPEAEAMIYNAMKLPDLQDLDSVASTIAGDDRFGSAVRFYEESMEARAFSSDTLILTAGQYDSLAMLADHLAATLNAQVLLTRRNSIPDIAARVLGLDQAQFSRIIVLGGTKHVSENIVSQAQAMFPDAVIERVEGDTAHDVALNIRERFAAEPWGDVAVVTWDGCTGDLISLFPYTLGAKASLFFLENNGVFDDAVIKALSSPSFTRVIALGNTHDLPEKDVARLPQSDIVRLEGRNPSHANRLINQWMDTLEMPKAERLVIAAESALNDALAVGPYSLDKPCRIVIENADNLDSMASAIETMKERYDGSQPLVFVGNEHAFNEVDKMLVAKVLRES